MVIAIRATILRWRAVVGSDGDGNLEELYAAVFFAREGEEDRVRAGDDAEEA